MTPVRAHRSPRFVVLLTAVTFVLALQFLQLVSTASGAPASKVAQRNVHAADSRQVVAAGNTLKATKTAGKPAPLARTGGTGVVSPTVSIAFLLMLDGALMMWFARPKERLA
jgi:hypothetical protein